MPQTKDFQEFSNSSRCSFEIAEQFLLWATPVPIVCRDGRKLATSPVHCTGHRHCFPRVDIIHHFFIPHWEFILCSVSNSASLTWAERGLPRLAFDVHAWRTSLLISSQFSVCAQTGVPTFLTYLTKLSWPPVTVQSQSNFSMVSSPEHPSSCQTSPLLLGNVLLAEWEFYSSWDSSK